MKATLKFEDGKWLHITLQPESEEERAECYLLNRYFNNFSEGTKVSLKLAYTSATIEASGDLKDITIGIELGKVAMCT